MARSNIKTTPEMEVQILELYNQGMSKAKIAEKFNFSTLPVDRVLQNNGLMPFFSKKITLEIEQKAIELHQEKVSFKDIMIKLNISKRDATGIFKNNNIIDQIHSIPQDIKNEIINLRLNNVSYKEIEKKTNLNSDAIKHILQKADLTKPRKNKISDPLDPIIKKQIIQFNKNRLTIQQISTILNISKSKVKIYYKELGLKANGKSPGAPRQNKIITEKICNCCEIIYNINQFQKRISKRRRSEGTRIIYSAQCDICRKLRSGITGAVADALMRENSSKNGASILQYLSYSIGELKRHIEKQFEPWMNWNNRGKYDPKTWNINDPTTWTWNLDHIIPHSTFKYTSMGCQTFQDCWALSNLRPYSAKDNIIDGGSRIRH